MELVQKMWDAYEWAWERRDRRVDDYILMQGSMIQDHLITISLCTVISALCEYLIVKLICQKLGF